MNRNELLKTIQAADFANGGELQVEQQKKFIDMVVDSSVLLKNCRTETVTNPSGELDKLYIGEPITEGASEDTDSSNQEAKSKTSKLTYSTTKVRTWYNITMDSIARNIEKEGFEDTFMAAVTKRLAVDLELLAIRGDMTTYSASTTPMGRLLKVLDGWDIQSAGSHIVDVGGSYIAKEHFASMYRRLPDEVKADPNLRWIMSKGIETDWLDKVADRLTASGDAALQGKATAPYGVPILSVPMVPSNKTLSISTGTPGWALGDRQGPFVVTSAAKSLKIDVDNAGAVSFDLTVGTLPTVEVCRQINAALGANIAIAENGFVLLQSTTTGSSSEIDVQAPVGTSANTLLGLTVASNAGAEISTADNVPQGSFIWLSNPQNFVSIMLNQTRIYTEFNPRKDRIEVTIYNEVAYKIEAIESMVKAINVRAKQ